MDTPGDYSSQTVAGPQATSQPVAANNTKNPGKTKKNRPSSASSSSNVGSTRPNHRKQRRNDLDSSLSNIEARFHNTHIKENHHRHNHGHGHGHGRKNQISINHLLDFQSYEDSEEYQNNHGRRGSGGHTRPAGANRRKNHHDKSTKVHLSGMSFINVNYKFIVDGRKQYKEQELDPNIPPNTDDIIRIVVPRGNSCPICLTDEPIAPRMISSCGHIMCLKCILSLLESEVPTSKKRESSAVVEKYRECPLCNSVIRLHEIKPVLINNVDTRFETPKINDDAVFTLMTRPHHKILPLPMYMHEYHSMVDNFPEVPGPNSTMPDFHQYSRIFKADVDYLTRMYLQEKAQIIESYEEEKVLYNGPETYVKMTINHIDNEISTWTNKPEAPGGDASKVKNIQSRKEESDKCYYFYQTGFDASATYILSPLDLKILKAAHNDSYQQLPSSVVATIENIRYEELTPELALTKYKYLAHLPSGTQLGFVECNWRNNKFINDEAWAIYHDDLGKRTKKSKQKLLREERDRRRAQHDEEARARDFYARENGLVEPENGHYMGIGGTLSITDHRELPSLPHDEVDNEEEGEYVTTVWGTKVPKAEYVDEAIEDDWDAEEMIRKAKMEMEKHQGKGKKKKKVILMSS